MENLRNETKKTSILDMEKSFIKQDISFLFWLKPMEWFKDRNLDWSVTIYWEEKSKDIKEKLKDRLLKVVEENSKDIKEWVTNYVKMNDSMEKWVSTQDIVAKFRRSLNSNLKID